MHNEIDHPWHLDSLRGNTGCSSEQSIEEQLESEGYEYDRSLNFLIGSIEPAFKIYISIQEYSTLNFFKTKEILVELYLFDEKIDEIYCNYDYDEILLAIRELKVNNYVCLLSREAFAK